MLAVLLSTVALAQTSPAQEPTFRTDVQVVLVPVVVRDSGGHTVADLTANDFQLYDKGKRQTITSFTVVKRVAPATRSESAATESLDSKNAKPSAPARQRRSIAYVFDDLDSRLGDFVNLRQAALRHFQAGLPAGDTAAIYTFSGRTSLEFTSDAAKLENAVAGLGVHLGPGHGDETPCPYVSYYLAHLIVTERDENALEAVTRQTMDCMGVKHEAAQNFASSEAQRQLHIGEQDLYVRVAALRRAIRQLERRPGQRLLVLTSSGFFTPTKEGTAVLAGILDLAARANVTISTMDARGVHLTGQVDATRRSAFSSLEDQYYRGSAHAAEGPLQDLAEGSGGTFFHNNNDMAAGFAQLASPPEFSYVIGFSPSSLKADGSFHALRIRLVNQNGASIQARHGYFAPGKSRAEDALAEQLDDAVFSREEVTDMPLDLAVEVAKSGTDAAQLLLVAKVYIKSLPFENAGGRNRDILTVVCAIYDEDGGYVAGNRNTIDLALRDETLAEADNPAIRVESNFHGIKPGTYLARVVARESGRSGLSARNVRVIVR